MRVGFLGPEGTFSEEASKIYSRKLPGKVKLIPYTTIANLLYAVNRGKIHEAICPLENSIEGTVAVVTDMLAKEVNLMIKYEIVIPIVHYLIGQKGIGVKEVTDVISHPQALDQCKDFLKKNLPKVKLHLAYSTSEAVRQVATSLGEKIIAHGKIKGSVFAAIGNISSAKLYNMKVLASNINAKENKTRFIVLAKNDHRPTGRDKTSIVFSGKKDRPGSLHHILGEFASRGINLTKIESRPSKKALGDYYFFADFEGHRTSGKVDKALKSIRKQASFLKVLGSYPKAK
jgi:prephenate dehydratase